MPITTQKLICSKQRKRDPITALNFKYFQNILKISLLDTSYFAETISEYLKNVVDKIKISW